MVTSRLASREAGNSLPLTPVQASSGEFKNSVEHFGTTTRSSYQEDDMHKTIWRALGAAGFALVLTASTVNAQDTVRVRGTIDPVEGPVYIVKSRDGSELKVSLADNGGVTAIVKASLSDIK